MLDIALCPQRGKVGREMLVVGSGATVLRPDLFALFLEHEVNRRCAVASGANKSQ